MSKSDEFMSRHFDNDDWQQYEFVRDSKLPYGTFDRPLRERIVEWAAVAIFALSLAGAIILCSTYL